MLYVIDDNIASHFSAGKANQRDIASLEMLAMGIAEGRHRLHGRRVTLQTLINGDWFSARAKGVFLQARNQVSQTGILPNQLRVYGRLVVSPGMDSPKHHAIGERREIRIPLDWFDESSKVQETILLGENLSDVKALLIIANVAITRMDLKYLPFRFDGRGGGGSTTGASIAQIAEQQQQCLCLVDSDRACPTGQIGDTARSVQQFKDPEMYPRIGIVETAGRDLENSLPLSFYRNQYSGQNQFAPLTNLLVGLANAGHHELILYLDIENGLTLRRHFQRPADSPERAYWETRIPILCNFLQPPNPAFPCQLTKVCANPNACMCIVCPGNRSDVLAMFSKVYETTNPFTLSALLSTQEWEEWCRLGIEVASWCCAEKKLRMY